MTQNKAEIIKKGETITLQGENSNFIYMLQSGAIEILSATKEFEGLDSATIIEHSTRVSLITEQTYFFSTPGITIRATADSKIQKLPVTIEKFAALAKQNPALAISILMHLFKRVEVSCAEISKNVKLYQNLCKVSDNLALMFKEVSSRPLPDSLEKRAALYNKNFNDAKGQFPAVFDTQFLIADRSNEIKKNYSLPEASIDSIFNKELYAFFKRFLRMDKNVFAHVIKSDPTMAAYMLNTVVGYLNVVYSRIFSTAKTIHEEMDLAFGASNSWTEQLVDKSILQNWLKSGRLSADFTKQLIAFIMKIYSFYNEVSGKNSEEIFPGLKKLKAFYSICQKSAAAEAHGNGAEGESHISSGDATKLYHNSLQQIFEFGLVDHDLQSRFLKGLNEFKKMSNPFSSESDGRKLRRQITTLYWELYTQVYLRSKVESKIPAPVKLMLMYGYVDENLMDPGQIEVLHDYADHAEGSSIPIMYEYEFLNKIYTEEESPSINEMGLTYEKYLLEKERMASRKKDKDEDENEVIKKIKYEISNRVNSTTSVCSGSRSTAFPIFTSMMLKGDPGKFIYTKNKLEQVIKDLIETDYSCFYRETILKLESAREIIEEEVLPNFILLPTYGTKVMMWQELVGTNKRSRGRIVIPVFFSGDLQKSLAHAFAVFRWELTRTMKGGMWADPVEGGVTGAYYDYIQFFKKNSKLSTDAKEKIAERLKGFRNNPRELFADDYIMWVTYEKNGIMKMNPFVRDMYYRYIPFRKKIRERLEKMPAFRDSAHRFQNIRNRTVTGYERRYKKYMNDQGNYPPEIQEFMNYLQM